MIGVVLFDECGYQHDSDDSVTLSTIILVDERSESVPEVFREKTTFGDR